MTGALRVLSITVRYTACLLGGDDTRSVNRPARDAASDGEKHANKKAEFFGAYACASRPV